MAHSEILRPRCEPNLCDTRRGYRHFPRKTDGNRLGTRWNIEGGVYVLLVVLKQGRRMKVGRLGESYFEKGIYFYVGSASRGIEGRIRRHLSRVKTLHWHVDYLLRYGDPIAAFCVSTSESDAECRIAKALSEKLKSVPSFGCSDCRCKSHLFYEAFEGRNDEKIS